MSMSGGCSVNREDIMSTLGDVQYIRVFNINQRLLSTCLAHMNHDIPRCTYGISLMY